MAGDPGSLENQTIEGGDNNDTLQGGFGDDTLTGGGGRDHIYGGEGDDTIYGGEGRDYIEGGSGDDTIYGGAGDDKIDGGWGDDTLTGGAGADTFEFSYVDGDDTITDFNTQEDVIDLLNFTNIPSFSSLTITQEGDDAVIDLSAYSGGKITLENVSVGDLSAANFKFRIEGTESDDTLTGGAGDEVIKGWGGDDTLHGGAGDDDLYGGSGDDTLTGGAGDDYLYAAEGDDTLKGGAGNDTLYGASGDDTLEGGAGNDFLDGGDGADTFVFAADHGDDTIRNFSDGEDTIDLTAITAITEFSDLTITQRGFNAVIDLTDHGGGKITLTNFNSTNLDADDFVFYEPATTTTPDDGGDGM